MFLFETYEKSFINKKVVILKKNTDSDDFLAKFVIQSLYKTHVYEKFLSYLD